MNPFAVAAAVAIALSCEHARASGPVASPVSVSCTLEGEADLDATVYANATGSDALVVVAGYRTILVKDLPSDPAVGRVSIQTRSADGPGLLVDGYVEGDALSVTAKHALTVVPKTLAIEPGRRLRVVRGASDWVASPAESDEPPFANVSAKATCADLRVGEGDVAPFPKAETYYALKSASIPLHASAGGAAVLTLDVNAPGSTPVGGLETKNGFVHVVARGVFDLNGWIPAKDLGAWTGDPPLNGPVCGNGLMKLWFKGPKSNRVALADTEVFLGPNFTALRAGLLEKGARVHATAATSGFSAIQLSAGGVSAPVGKKLYVRTKDLGGA